jgi:hypothetical protein
MNQTPRNSLASFIQILKPVTASITRAKFFLLNPQNHPGYSKPIRKTQRKLYWMQVGMVLAAIQKLRLAIRIKPIQDLLGGLGNPIKALIMGLRLKVLGFTTTSVIVRSDLRTKASFGIQIKLQVRGLLISCSMSEGRCQRWPTVSRVRPGLRLAARRLCGRSMRATITSGG